jgi:hypothetical protein
VILLLQVTLQKDVTPLKLFSAQVFKTVAVAEGSLFVINMHCEEMVYFFGDMEVLGSPQRSF